MNKKFIITAAALLGVALIFWLIPKIFFKAPTTTPETNTTTTNQAQETIQTTKTLDTFLNEGNITTLTDQAQKEFSFVLAESKKWRTDALMVAMITKYTDKVDVANGKNLYIFFSPSLPEYYFEIAVDQTLNANRENKFTRIIRFKEDYQLPTNLQIIPLKYWQLNYLDALKKANENGGAEIIKATDKYDINLMLYAQENDYLYWNVEYLDKEGNVLFKSKINAYTGELL